MWAPLNFLSFLRLCKALMQEKLENIEQLDEFILRLVGNEDVEDKIEQAKGKGAVSHTWSHSWNWVQEYRTSLCN